jgi:hypothetical protein
MALGASMSMMSTMETRTMKKSNNPQETTSDPLMTQFRHLQSVLADTGASIPRLLSEQRQLREELGSAEIEGTDIQRTKERLATVTAALASAARQRQAAGDGMLSLADGLRQERAAMEQELAAMAQAVVAEFNGRWSRACEELGRLHAEAALLSRALRANVVAVPPYTTSLSADGTRMNVVYSGLLEVDTVMVPPEVAAITSQADEVDAAMCLCAAVAQAKEWDQRYVAMQRTRSGNMPVMNGTYTVIKRFDHMGARFEPGMLVDQTLMGSGTLHRRWQGREIVPVDATVASAA